MERGTQARFVTCNSRWDGRFIEAEALNIRYTRGYTKMKATTIKLDQRTKARLDRERQAEETYAHVIQRLLRGQRRDIAAALIEASRANATRDRQLAKEWEPADAPWPEY